MTELSAEKRKAWNRAQAFGLTPVFVALEIEKDIGRELTLNEAEKLVRKLSDDLGIALYDGLDEIRARLKNKEVKS